MLRVNLYLCGKLLLFLPKQTVYHAGHSYCQESEIILFEMWFSLVGLRSSAVHGAGVDMQVNAFVCVYW